MFVLERNPMLEGHLPTSKRKSSDIKKGCAECYDDFANAGSISISNHDRKYHLQFQFADILTGRLKNYNCIAT